MNPAVTITTFTDPMMGLSYECEPLFRRLETHYGTRIHFKYAMGVLVRNVYDFVNPADLVHGKTVAIERYNARLAKIYESEQGLSGMPINMNGFALFDVDNTSSLPLNLAFKAVEAVAPRLCERFLYNLRFATIVDCRPTTHFDEILEVVELTGVDRTQFIKVYNSDVNEKRLLDDLRQMAHLGIYSMPAYLLQYEGRSLLIKSFIGYDEFVSFIGKLTNSAVKPKAPQQQVEAVIDLIRRHPLISPIELREAFDFKTTDDVVRFLQPLVTTGEVEIMNVYHGQFVKLKQDIK